MSAVTVVQLREEKRMLYALTVDQYHQMIDNGILPEGEPFELIAALTVISTARQPPSGTSPPATRNRSAS